MNQVYMYMLDIQNEIERETEKLELETKMIKDEIEKIRKELEQFDEWGLVYERARTIEKAY